MPNILFIILSAVIGGVIAWLFAGSRAKSAGAVNSELRQQILQKDTELSKIRADLMEEKQARASMDAKYQEAEKTYGQ